MPRMIRTAAALASRVPRPYTTGCSRVGHVANSVPPARGLGRNPRPRARRRSPPAAPSGPETVPRPLRAGRTSHRRRNPMRHSRTSLALAVVLVSPFAALAVPAPSHAAETLAEWAFDRAGTCATTLSGDSVDWAAGSHCVGDRLGGLLVDEAARFVTEQGRGGVRGALQPRAPPVLVPARAGAGRGAGRGHPAGVPRRRAARRRCGRAARQRDVPPAGG